MRATRPLAAALLSLALVASTATAADAKPPKWDVKVKPDKPIELRNDGSGVLTGTYRCRGLYYFDLRFGVRQSISHGLAFGSASLPGGGHLDQPGAPVCDGHDVAFSVPLSRVPTPPEFPSVYLGTFGQGDAEVLWSTTACFVDSEGANQCTNASGTKNAKMAVPPVYNPGPIGPMPTADYRGASADITLYADAATGDFTSMNPRFTVDQVGVVTFGGRYRCGQSPGRVEVQGTVVEAFSGRKVGIGLATALLTTRAFPLAFTMVCDGQERTWSLSQASALPEAPLRRSDAIIRLSIWPRLGLSYEPEVRVTAWVRVAAGA